jgi:hypothetical protein
VKFTDEEWAKLSQRDRNLHEKAFTNNAADPAYRELTTLRYRDSAVEREMKVPKGDVLYQFRKDVGEGKLPAVSWLVPPENFSDHPGAPWYGAWMVSEVLPHSDAESRGLEENDFRPDLRRKRRLFRSRAAIRRARPKPSRDGEDDRGDRRPRWNIGRSSATWRSGRRRKRAAVPWGWAFVCRW